MNQRHSSGQAIDPMTLTVVYHKLKNIVDNMSEILARTATSFILCEILDFCSCLLDRNGRIIVQSDMGLPFHVASAELQLECARERFGDDFQPGDVVLQNDPYEAAGNHLPDWTLIQPVFVDDELSFFALCKGHQMDTKGAYPGGYFPDGYDIHAEGLLIKPTKIFAAGRKTDVYDFILDNVRWPESVRIDNMAMMAALRVAQKRVVELCAKYGREAILAIGEVLMAESEKAVRREIRAIPDGTYTGESIADRDGSGTESVKVHVAITVEGDEMLVDFSGSDGQVKFINAPIGATYSTTYMGILPAFDASIIKNHGALVPIRINAPKGLVVNPEFPATVGACGCFVGTNIIEAVQMAMGKALPNKVAAAWCPSFTMVTFGVDDRNAGEPAVPYWMVTFHNDGGSGAIEGHDGCHHVAPVVCGGRIIKCPVELAEIAWPYRIVRYEFLIDSAGPGRFRGGLGTRWEAVNVGCRDSIATTGAMSGEKQSPFGLNGGKDAICGEIYVLDRDGNRRTEHTMSQFAVSGGETLGTISSGGGGVGSPLERPPEKVRDDVVNGYVSVEAAAEDYGVVLDPITCEIDEAATRSRRTRTAVAPAAPVN